MRHLRCPEPAVGDVLRVRYGALAMPARLITNVSYTGPRTRGQSSARLARYLTLRQVRDREQDRVQDRVQDRARYETLQLAGGDQERFEEAARERAKKGRRSSYVHVVISPERPGYQDRDLKALAREWTRDRHGREAPHIAVIHRDTQHPHIHVAVARDKLTKDELRLSKERTGDVQRERERMIDRRQERERAREQEREKAREEQRQRREQERERQREAERERDRQRGRDYGRERDDSYELER